MRTQTFRLVFAVATLFFSHITCSEAQLDRLTKATDKANSVLRGETQPATRNSAPASGARSSSAPASAGSQAAGGKDYYISPNGNGRVASKEQPAKELGVVIPQLQAGDRIHIAAGTYLGATERGSDIIEVPVSIIGGYSPDFSRRDPWGAYQTILSGTNEYMKESTERIGILTDKKFRDWSGEIIIDGLIIDNGPRNRYVQKKDEYILRKADESAMENPSPETPGIKIRTGGNISVIVRNCLITNTAPTQGALDVQIGKNAGALIENNAIINNTGEGIMCKSNHQGADGLPRYTLRNNTVLFCWKHDEIATYGGNCIKMDPNCIMTVEDNVLGFGDFGGVDNIKQCKNLTLKGNLFFGHKKWDYKEFNTAMKLDDLDDYGQYLTAESGGNFTSAIRIPANGAWAEKYLARVDVNRGEVEANVKVSNSGWNQVRGILGLPLQGSSVGAQAKVWLHRLPLANALKAAQQYEGKGCRKP